MGTGEEVGTLLGAVLTVGCEDLVGVELPLGIADDVGTFDGFKLGFLVGVMLTLGCDEGLLLGFIDCEGSVVGPNMVGLILKLGSSNRVGIKEIVGVGETLSSSDGAALGTPVFCILDVGEGEEGEEVMLVGETVKEFPGEVGL